MLSDAGGEMFLKCEWGREKDRKKNRGTGTQVRGNTAWWFRAFKSCLFQVIKVCGNCKEAACFPCTIVSGGTGTFATFWKWKKLFEMELMEFWSKVGICPS